jgi:AraC-like DNA-binding protein
MSYRERPSRVGGTVLWQRSTGPHPTSSRILPDGCLDVLWDGHRLVVAGPDSTARRVESSGQSTSVGLRFSGGIGPALLGVPADELLDRSPGLDEVWPTRQARELTDRVAADPVAGLEAWAAELATSCDIDPLGARVLHLAAAGLPVATMADELGFSTRQLHRRCLPIFGYGPRRLARVLRLHRALDQARAGAPLAEVAFDSGYADQPHLNREVRELAGTTPSVLLEELGHR